jgi:hypothetical protein
MFDVFWFQPGPDGEGNWYWGGTFRTKAFAETNVKQKLTVATAMKVGMKVRIIDPELDGAQRFHVYSADKMPLGEDHTNGLWDAGNGTKLRQSGR